MKRLLLYFLPVALLAQTTHRLALPGYRFAFPRDHFSHPEFQTEWWYWTGSLTGPANRKFGFELTFFRHNLNLAIPLSAWAISDVYLAHLAITDVAGKRFYHAERVNRAGPGLAGAEESQALIWNGNWRAEIGEKHSLRALTPDLSLDLRLTPRKPPVIHGKNGISQKAPGEGKASHYISFPRLGAEGTIRIGEQEWRVNGLAWMDHEFFTNQLGTEQVGWDWFCIQLDNGEELMFYRLRRRDGSGDTLSSGTFIDSHGKARTMSAAEFSLAPEGECWASPQSKACYPLQWQIRVPSLGLNLKAEPLLPDQELYGTKSVSPVYWEGAMSYSGSRSGSAIRGVGYLELTGYHSPFSFEPK